VIKYWKIGEQLQKEVEENYRTDFSRSLKEESALTIIRELTFDSVLPQIRFEDVENLFLAVQKKALKKPLQGKGLEIGAGPATWSSAIVSANPLVEKMYAVEVCVPIVELLTPKVAESFLGPQKKEKVIGCVGEFDNIELPDNSLDFIFDFFSLHHSYDPKVTIKECGRVLKSGGLFICLDKARPDNFSDSDLEKLLDKEYEEDFKKRINIGADEKLNRRMNGENEYRLRDWVSYFKSNNFSLVNYFCLQKTSSPKKISQLIKKAIAFIPFSSQKYFAKYLSKRDKKDLFRLEEKNLVFIDELNPFRKEMSLMVFKKN